MPPGSKRRQNDGNDERKPSAESKPTKRKPLRVKTYLGISVKTVETHRTNLLRKLRCANVAELIRYAFRNGLVDL